MDAGRPPANRPPADCPPSTRFVAPAVLVVAMVLCAAVVHWGPGLADAVAASLGGLADSPALGETVGTATLFGALLLLGLIGGAMCERNATATGSRPVRNLAAGAAMGLFGITAAAGFAWLAGTLAPAAASPHRSLLLWGSLLVLFQAAAEEVFFRGWVQRVLVEGWGRAAGVLVAALAFAGLHVMGGARSPVTLVNLFAGGLLFGLLFARGGGLAAPIGAHWAWNWGEEMLLGLSPNPGIGGFGALADLDLHGAALWGGSDEGLNASAAMTVALLALVVPLLVLARRRPASLEQRRHQAA